MQNGLVSRDAYAGHLFYPNVTYPREFQDEVTSVISEAVGWLESSVLLVPAEGINGSNGFRVLSRRGNRLIDPTEFSAYRAGSLLPKHMLHKRISEKVWLLFIRGDHDTAVFQAFKEVEVAVRAAAKLADTDLGVNLMRKAFHAEDGPGLWSPTSRIRLSDCSNGDGSDCPSIICLHNSSLSLGSPLVRDIRRMKSRWARPPSPNSGSHPISRTHRAGSSSPMSPVSPEPSTTTPGMSAG